MVRKHRGPIQFRSKWCSGCTPIVHAAKWLFANPIKTDVFSFLLGQIVRGGPNRTRRARPPQPAALGDASVAKRFPQGSARKFVCNKGASPVTRRSSSSRAPFTRHLLLGSKVAAAVFSRRYWRRHHAER